MKELCFKLVLKKESINDNSIIDDFISFALNNDLSFGGDFDNGCFINQNKSLDNKIKDRFIDYLKSNYSNTFSEVIFQKFDETLNDFTDLDKVLIR